MQHFPLHHALKIDSHISIRFTSLAMILWGRELHFTCLAGDTEFQLSFLDCREMRWQLYSHIQDEARPAFPPTELANLKLGRNQHRSPAHLLTEHFGLSLVYGDLKLHHEGEVISLGAE